MPKCAVGPLYIERLINSVSQLFNVRKNVGRSLANAHGFIWSSMGTKTLRFASSFGLNHVWVNAKHFLQICILWAVWQCQNVSMWCQREQRSKGMEMIKRVQCGISKMRLALALNWQLAAAYTKRLLARHGAIDRAWFESFPASTKNGLCVLVYMSCDLNMFGTFGHGQLASM